MTNKLKIYYDAEFTGLHRDTTLISIGLVCEDGHYFYGEFTDYDTAQYNEWISNNVIDNLMFNDYDDGYKVNRSNVFIKANKNRIGIELEEWLRKLYERHKKQIQIYCDCYAYDWMLFNDLICRRGNALNLPESIYYIPMDLSTALQIHGYDPDVTREEFISDSLNDIKSLNVFKNNDEWKHNSLWDAYVCKYCFNKLEVVDTDKSVNVIMSSTKPSTGGCLLAF